MKLIKLTRTEIYDVDTAVLYTIAGPDNDLYVTPANGAAPALILNEPASLNLWGYLDEESNNQSWRNAQPGQTLHGIPMP